jgi:trigger factor
MADETKTDVPEDADASTATAEGAEKPEKLTQAVEMKDVGPCKKHIKVTVERGAIDKRLNDKYSELTSDANVAGFRPGKAPRKIIEKRFQKDVTDQVKAEVMMQSLEQLGEEHDVAPLSPPNIDPAKIDLPKDGPLVYEFEVEVRPQFDLPDYKGLKLKRQVHTFTDEEINEQEQRLVAPHGQVVPKPEGNAKIGDYVVGDVVFKDGDQTISELKETTLRVEKILAFNDGFVRDFADQVKGAKAGDVKSVEVNLLKSSARPELADKKVKGEIHVKEVKTVRLPELTHELMHQFGVHSPEQLRERIRVALERRLEYQQRQSARQQVLQHIAAAATWDLPQDLLARQARAALGRRVMEMRAGGMSDEEIQARLRIMQQDVLNSTALALKEHFVLQKIAETEKIDVSEDDINDEIERIAYENNESPRRIRARLEKEDLLESLAIEMIERKVLDLIFQNAKYEDEQVANPVDNSYATVEAQIVPGQMTDPTAPPPAEQPEAEKK